MKCLALAVTAAAAFTGGGLLMKLSEGLSRLVPTIGLFALFIFGAAVTAKLVHLGGELGPAYLMVVGLETVLAVAAGVFVFGEPVTPIRLTAVVLVLSGTLLLKPSVG